MDINSTGSEGAPESAPRPPETGAAIPVPSPIDIPALAEPASGDASGAPEAEAPKRRRKRMMWTIWGALGVLVIVVGVAVAIGARSKPMSADEALSRAAAFVDDAKSYQYDVVTTTHSTTGEKGGAGSEMTDRTLSSGRVALPDRWYDLTEDGFMANESMMIGEKAFNRTAEDKAALDDELWIEYPDLAEAAETSAGDDALGMIASGGWSPLTDIGEVLAALDKAAVLDRQPDRISVGSTVDLPDADFPDEMLDGLSEAEIADMNSSVPEKADVELELLHDGTPLRLTVSAEATDSSTETVISFKNWNQPVEIEEPSADTIDPTPWLDEEALTEARASIVPVAPTAVPDGLQLLGITGLAVQDGTSYNCPELNITYGVHPKDADLYAESGDEEPFLDLYLYPKSCADDGTADFPDVDPFAPGPFGTLPVREDPNGGDWEVLVGDTVVQVMSSFDDEELAPILASLAPFDVDAALPAVSVLMEELWSDYGWSTFGLEDGGFIYADD